jgi:hypothetical protein
VDGAHRTGNAELELRLLGLLKALGPDGRSRSEASSARALHPCESDGLRWPRCDGLKWPRFASVVVLG